MSEMVRELFAGASLAGPLVALVLFVTVFVVATAWAIRAERSQVDRVAHLPLEGEVPTPEAHHG